jgi:soluble lytic murein transglycosylase
MKFSMRTKIAGTIFVVLLCFTCLHFLSPPRLVLEKSQDQKIIHRITHYLLNENQKLTESEAHAISRIVFDESKEYGLDYRLVLAIMKVESNFRSNVVSPKGARGLLQVKPSLAKFIAKDAGIEWNGSKTLDTPKENIRLGVHFLSGLLKDFETVHMALSAYNVGPARLKEIDPPRSRQPRGFSKQVLTEYRGNLSLLPDP